jgi:hypothetical protein
MIKGVSRQAAKKALRKDAIAVIFNCDQFSAKEQEKTGFR